ncbi:hypothetical protein Q5424_02010 [Conexibacter sp. JD483]|uniref:hypothetical protein n=1 Tax=unclassified Conexibacter TaxID=2627773 RepID=UPI00272577FF|nr:MULTISPECIES: hypothetical protein [unclassified Conexibacter]MDO8185643.1 hypothetical protein [Conexibacter sp. CPCC 205706]MDO8198816.1 hypothetical protein [Conexibacter sp. CPCC 205762]MDR9367834.1 hypothetical protein [Conexibacter sp. JD483]
MDRDELRPLQAPLKERYRDEPEAALVTLLKLTERYCVVLQTLARSPELSAELAAA